MSDTNILASTTPLAKLFERQKELNSTLDQTLAGKLTQDAESRAYQIMEEQQDVEARIRVQSIREDGRGAIVLNTPSAKVTAESGEFRAWIAGGYRQGPFEMRTVAMSALGGAATANSDEFTAMMDRDSVIARLATVITTDAAGPIKFWRQTSQLGVQATATAENGAGTASDTAGGTLTLTPTKSAHYADVSIETLRSLPYDVSADVARQQAEMHAFSWESAYAIGNLAQQAITSVSTGNTVSVDHASASSAWGAITPTEALTTIYSTTMRTAYLTDAVWLLNPVAWARTASQTSSTPLIFGGGYMESVARDGVGVRFMGFPVHTTAAIATPTATTDPFGVFGSVRRGYRIVRVNGVQFLADPYTLGANGTVRFLSHVFGAGGILDRNAMVSLLA